MWRHPRLSSGSSFHPPLNPVGIPSGGSPSSIKPEAAGAVSVVAAPSQLSIPSLPPSSSALFTPRAQRRRSHPSCAEFALQMSAPSQLAGGKPGPAPTRSPAIRDTQASSGDTKASRAGANMHLLFLLLQKALVAAASHFSSFYL